MNEEINAVEKNDTWELTTLQSVKKPIGVNGFIRRRKIPIARLRDTKQGLSSKEWPRAWNSRIDNILLGWPKRFHIINGIARGLVYLHQDSDSESSIEISNKVLLDSNIDPEISDFNLARSLQKARQEQIQTEWLEHIEF
ncbi:LOW QUALITY PROTEIN: hypothetical protein RJ639_003814 [Escallonia herrerae]|uniref:Uncharacterized protein n=1 Tax=Escallonia herrerae TaxID=1293975 RepID=A0AA89B229_9ASTE|nr:LOW QUALITY PROTEIN: hypothetical protein RJ639_003814 [Escallonia herrerae]